MQRKPDLGRCTFIPSIVPAAFGFLFLPRSVYVADEIQVYNAEIAELGQWTIQQHLNYTFLGPMVPPFGVGYGFTHGSDRLIAKIILGYAFPVPGANEKDNDQLPTTPPTLKSARGLLQLNH
jgi:hypothetical protein